MIIWNRSTARTAEPYRGGSGIMEPRTAAPAGTNHSTRWAIIALRPALSRVIFQASTGNDENKTAEKKKNTDETLHDIYWRGNKRRHCVRTVSAKKQRKLR